MALAPRAKHLRVALGVLVWVVGCRFGYEQVDLLGGAGTGGPGIEAAGQQSAGLGGSAQVGGDSSRGGAPDGAGTTGDAAGEPGTGATLGVGGQPDVAGAPGQAGADGQAGAPNPSQCTPTADCSCASFEGKSYWFCNNVLEWDASEQHCQTQSMHLVRVDSASENDFLVQIGTQFAVFDYSGVVRIGGSDQMVQGEWLWMDGTLFWQGGASGAAVGGLYTNWKSGFPSLAGTRDCGGLEAAGTWVDRACKFVSPFVCESP